MKQLLIVKSSAALNGGASTPKDLSGMTAGSIGFFALNNKATWLAAAPTSNFAIALGRPNNSPAFVIPEVDINTLKVTEVTKASGVAYSGSITIPTVAAGKTYTLVLVKLGTEINERNKWTQTVTIKSGDSSTNAAAVAKAMRDGFQALADTGAVEITVSGTGAAVTVTGKNVGEGWVLKPGDDLYGTSVTETVAQKAIGDKAYIEDLARKCAGNKGFNYTDLESQHIYPGYPETVEDTAYNIFCLRFATGRESGKQTDERIWQEVYIAVPYSSDALSSIETILTQPVLPNEASEESNEGGE